MMTLEEALNKTKGNVLTPELEDICFRLKPIADDVLRSPLAKGFAKSLVLNENPIMLMLCPEAAVLQAMAIGVMIGVLMEKQDTL